MSRCEGILVVDKKEEVVAEILDWVSCNCDRRENPTGSYHGRLTWETDRIFANYKEAVAWVDKSSYASSYNDVVVKFYSYDSIDENHPKLVEIKEKRKLMYEKYLEYQEKNRLQNRISKTITCTKCKSNLNIDYLYNSSRDLEKRANCPLCRETLLSKTVLDRLNKYISDLELLWHKYEDMKLEIAKKMGKSKVSYLVKVSTHC